MRCRSRRALAAPRVRDEQSDRLVAHAQRHGHRGRLWPAAASAARAGASAARCRRCARESPSAARSGPSERVQQARRDLLVPRAETASRGGVQPAVLAQVDADLLDLQQLRDALDRRLERVREREARDRLADHLEQRARAVELELDVGGALGGAERMRRAGRERGERRQVGLGRDELLAVEQLQRGERRLAERQCRGVGRAAGQPGLVARSRSAATPRRDSTTSSAARSSPVSIGPTAGDELPRRLAADAPERAPAGAGRLDGEPDRLQRRPLRSPPAASASPASSSHLARRRRPDRPVPSVRTASATCAATSSATARSSAPKSSATRTSSTEPTIRAGGTSGQRQRSRRAHAFRRAPRRLRDLARGDRITGGASAGDLRAERRPVRSERARNELPVRIEDAHDRDVGAGCLRRRTSEDVERGAQIVARGDLGRRPCDGFDGQQLGLYDHRERDIAWILGVDSADGRARSATGRAPSLDPARDRAQLPPRTCSPARTHRAPQRGAKRSNVRFWITLLVLAS